MRRLASGLLGSFLALTACTGSSTPESAPSETLPTAPHTASHGPVTPRPASYGWPTYHGDNQRTGVSQSPALTSPLRRAWSRDLDGAVYAQPLLVDGALVVATEG